jgi:hypothetical protein
MSSPVAAAASAGSNNVVPGLLRRGREWLAARAAARRRQRAELRRMTREEARRQTGDSIDQYARNMRRAIALGVALGGMR